LQHDIYDIKFILKQSGIPIPDSLMDTQQSTKDDVKVLKTFLSRHLNNITRQQCIESAKQNMLLSPASRDLSMHPDNFIYEECSEDGFSPNKKLFDSDDEKSSRSPSPSDSILESLSPIKDTVIKQSIRSSNQIFRKPPNFLFLKITKILPNMIDRKNNRQPPNTSTPNPFHSSTSTSDSMLDYWGDPMSTKSDNTIRIFSQNVNGFSIPKNDFTGGSFSTFYQQLLPSDFDIICCQELNLDTNQPTLRRLLSSITSRHFSKGIFTCSQTPGSHTHSFYKPGGTSITLTSSISSRLHETRNDPWGRWTGVILNGRSPIKIAIYSIYQVINTSWAAVAGTQTISAQHYMLIHNLYDSSQQSLSPKKKFQTDFQTELKFVQQHITPHILVIGDFNESNSSDFISHISAIFSLNNLLLEHHPNCKLPSTYTRGRRCLDHALGTSIFQQSLQKCG